LLAVGENAVFFMNVRGTLMKYDIENNTVAYSLTLFNIATEGAFAVPFTVRNKGGNLQVQAWVLDRDEAAGSRNLYLKTLTIDPSDMSTTIDDSITFSGSADLVRIGEFNNPRLLYGGVVLLGGGKEPGTTTEDYRILRINLNNKSYDGVQPDTGHNYYGAPQDFMIDQTTKNLYILTVLHEWYPGTGNTIILCDPKTLTSVSTVTNIDTGAGSYYWPVYYVDTTGKVRRIYAGTSGAATYTTKWNSIYVNNDTIVAEFTRTADSSYRDGTAGNVEFHCIGTTTDGKIALLLHNRLLISASSPGQDFTEGTTFTTTADDLTSPTKVSSQTYSVTTADTVTSLTQQFVYLSEDDWCYYLPNEMVNTTWYWGKLDLSGTGVTIDVEDPYNVILVPKTGLIPTTLTLQVTPL